MLTLLILCLATFCLSLFWVKLLRQRLTMHFLDRPNERSSHRQPTPRGGGLGFILAVMPTAIWAQFSGRYLTSEISNFSWLALLPLVLVGMLDDWQDVSSKLRYGVQLLVAGLIVWQAGPFHQPWLTTLGMGGYWGAIATTILGFTALINFYNFMDGIDGLVAGVSAIQLGFLAINSQEPILWLVVSALGGFLYWNWSPAKIFMGDVGSTFLGAMIGIALLHQTGTTAHIWSTLAITLPLTADAIYTLCCRLGRQENIFQAHRTHVYQRLHQSGWQHGQIAGGYIGLTVTIALLIHTYEGLGAGMSVIVIGAAIFGVEQYLQGQDQISSP